MRHPDFGDAGPGDRGGAPAGPEKLPHGAGGIRNPAAPFHRPGLLDTYRSDSYGQGAALELDSENQLLAGGKRVLPPGAYGNGAYQVRELRVLCGQGGFTIHLAVGEGNGDITASTPEEGVFVRCLNRLTEGEAP